MKMLSIIAVCVVLATSAFADSPVVLTDTQMQTVTAANKGHPGHRATNGRVGPRSQQDGRVGTRAQ